MRRDLEVQAWLHARSVRVPEVLDSCLEEGWILLEDFGREDAEDRLVAASSGPELNTLLVPLVDPLLRLAGLDVQTLPGWNAPLDEERMRWELAGFELWFVAHLAGCRPPPSLGRWLDGICEQAASHPLRVCHRDYHLNNLFILGDGEVGVIDAQDVLVGPDTYDLVSLLYERAMPEILGRSAREDLLNLWADRSGAAPGWRSRLDLVRLQRGLKVIGTFARLVVSGREQYRPWLTDLTASIVGTVERHGPPPDLPPLLLDWNLG